MALGILCLQGLEKKTKMVQWQRICNCNRFKAYFMNFSVSWGKEWFTTTFLITICDHKHHGGSGEVNKERIFVNSFLYVLLYRYRCIIFPSFFSMLQTLNLVQQRVLIARILPGWLSGKQTPGFFRLTQRHRTTSNLAQDNVGRRYKWISYRSFSHWASLCLNPSIQGCSSFF